MKKLKPSRLIGGEAYDGSSFYYLRVDENNWLYTNTNRRTNRNYLRNPYRLSAQWMLVFVKTLPSGKVIA